MTGTIRATRKPINGAWIAVLFVGSYFIARGVLEQQHWSVWLRLLSVIPPIAFFALMLWSIIRGVQQLDELEQRIQLLALAVAFPLTLLLLMTLGLLELVIKLPPQDLSYRHVWAIVPIFYFFGIVIARKRYS
jgi:hypothetical protein